MQDRMEVILGDITRLHVDAIVNAANHTLLGGGGVDGAIHRAAGPALREACAKLNGCQTGEAKITLGYNLPAKYVIHTVGPVWKGGTFGEDELLASCYNNSCKLAKEHDVKTLAFPAISTGAYGFPIERAAKIAIQTVDDFLAHSQLPEKVFFVCFSQRDYDVYQAALAEILRQKEID
ncbi:MAG: O-acetyl-ADP-ribose deacetylase [Candidatus Thermochlorobacter aerophilum]|jgi:Predicted phosphatase homologous to the C-terminal domain of histone macroH2A1|uniref:O-acetyl-ADP-ribose deacetylase n=1 Tax=Candidatus Thermochlorobacter aerophilus TaxID=1868324 RepID=A0A395M361_9BACT|nr:MAG: O-acetyl-ADP-ribose deacetylase [Candidatus Thermochlorobacter aerophilum]